VAAEKPIPEIETDRGESDCGKEHDEASKG
jgi:hypothetical protein